MFIKIDAEFYIQKKKLEEAFKGFNVDFKKPFFLKIGRARRPFTKGLRVKLVQFSERGLISVETDKNNILLIDELNFDDFSLDKDDNLIYAETGKIYVKLSTI